VRPGVGDGGGDGRLQAGGGPGARHHWHGRPPGPGDRRGAGDRGRVAAAPGARVSRVLPGWGVAQVKRLGASAAKLLVYYHPDAPNAADQERLVAEVAAACREADLALFLEPLSFGLDGGKLQGEDRRRVVVETAARLTALGADILKAEFPYDAAVTDETRW